MSKIKKRPKKTASKKPSSSAVQQSFAKKFQIDIPEDCDTLEDYLQWLSDEAEKPYLTLEISNARYSIKIGQLLLVAKEKVKNHKGGPKKAWGQYLNEYFPKHKRTAQTAMQLARHIDLEEFPAAVRLGKTKLTQLVRLAKAKDSDIMDFLQDKGIDTDIDRKTYKEIEKFRKAVDKVLKKAKAKKHEKKRRKDRIAEMVDAFLDPLRMALKNAKQAKAALLKNIDEERKFRDAIREKSRKAEIEGILRSMRTWLKKIEAAAKSPKATAKKMTPRSLQQRDV